MKKLILIWILLMTLFLSACSKHTGASSKESKGTIHYAFYTTEPAAQ